MSATTPLAVFGGTFDPVHFGHLRTALEAMEHLELRSLTLLPAGCPPHRPGPHASAVHRLAMLRLAASSCPGFGVDDRELRRAGLSYMVDTLAEIRGEIGAARPLLLLLGQDAANALDSWHEWRSLFELCSLVILRRPDFQLSCAGELREQLERRAVAGRSQLAGHAAGAVWSVETTQLDISATMIRELFAAGRSPRFLMPDAVIQYIEENRLYN